MDILRQALEHYGVEAQLDQLVEECGEFVTARNHYRRRRIGLVWLLSEVADLEIMCAQMRIAFGDEVIDYEKRVKLDRLRAELGEVVR